MKKLIILTVVIVALSSFNVQGQTPSTQQIKGAVIQFKELITMNKMTVTKKHLVSVSWVDTSSGICTGLVYTYPAIKLISI